MAFEWVTEDTRTFMSRGYLLEGVSVEERAKQIAETAQKYLPKNPEFKDKFYDYLSKGFYSLSTPVWSNFGLSRGLPVSCFGSNMEDRTESILMANAEVGMMSKFGGGTSGYFGKLRPRGAPITNNGQSDGAVSFMKLYDGMVDTLKQGATRRGSFAAYLPIDHPDIDEFLDIKDAGNPIQNIFTAVTITDEWMEDMLDGDKEKRRVWARLLQARSERGIPYVFFHDTVNNNKSQVYKDLDMEVNASNLCITGDSRVVTDMGYLRADELYDYGKELTLFSGNEAVKSSAMKLREENAHILNIVLDNGMEMKMTDYHGVPVMDKSGKISRVEAKDLKIGDEVAIQTNKGLFGTTNMPQEAFLLGLYHGDGTQIRKSVIMCLWENDFDLEDEVVKAVHHVIDTHSDGTFKSIDNRTYTYSYPEFREATPSVGGVRKRTLSSSSLRRELDFEKGVIPDWLWSADEETHWQFIRGLLYADGTVRSVSKDSYGAPAVLSIANVDREYLQQVQLIMNNLGISTSIRLLREGGETLLPDGKGGMKKYNTQTTYRLIVGNRNDLKTIEENTGFLTRKGAVIPDREYRDNTKKRYKVVSIEDAGYEDVYCPTVYNDENIFVAQGMRTFNCAEITLPATEDESFVCVLSSMNIAKYDEWKGTDAPDVLIMFLDAVNSEFVERTENLPLMERTHKFAKRHRALGAGALGWHTYLQSKNIAFESLEADLHNNIIFKEIREGAERATKLLAELYGEPEVMRGTGRRNSALMAIAPTTSSAFILGQVSQSIEPIKSNYYVRDLAKSVTTYRNPFLKERLAELGEDTPETWRSILENNGSVQHLDFLDEHTKNVFKTFAEVSQLDIIIQAATRQKHIDQSQSLNITVHPDTPPRDISQLHIEAWKRGVKTLYYQHSINAASELNRDLLTCSSCEG